MRLCCSTPRTAVAGARSATSAPALCRSMKRFGASATIHTSWNCARHSGEPRQPIDAQDERRSLETTDVMILPTIFLRIYWVYWDGKHIAQAGCADSATIGDGCLIRSPIRLYHLKKAAKGSESTYPASLRMNQAGQASRPTGQDLVPCQKCGALPPTSSICTAANSTSR